MLMLPQIQRQTYLAARHVWLVCLLSLFFVNASLAAEAVPEVSVVIDVSGSMKKNDPNNLRLSAADLFVNLVPKPVSLGVWLFGDKAELIWPVTMVNKDNLAKVEARLTKIRASDMHTDIGVALLAASERWKANDGNAPRIIVILTDGFQDVSKETTENAKSRTDILEKILPTLKAKKIRVFTLGLSENVDNDLLQRLAVSTGGVYHKVTTANALQRTFAAILEAALPRNGLPMAENKFIVDKATQEFTLLVFHEAKIDFSLKSPDNKIYTEKKHEATCTWKHDPTYDLIVMKNPAAGEWQVALPQDPANRIFVLSDLNLKLTGMRSNALVTEALPIEMQIMNKEVAVTNKDFINKLKMTVTLSQKDQKITFPVAADANGKFALALNFPPDAEGLWSVEIVAQSDVFTRRLAQSINLYPTPVVATVLPGDKEMLLKAVPREDLVKKGSVVIKVIVRDKDQKLTQYIINEKTEFKPIPLATAAGQRYIAALSADGKMLDDKPFSVTLPPMLIEAGNGTPAPAPVLAPAKVEKPKLVNHLHKAWLPALKLVQRYEHLKIKFPHKLRIDKVKVMVGAIFGVLLMSVLSGLIYFIHKLRFDKLKTEILPEDQSALVTDK